MILFALVLIAAGVTGAAGLVLGGNTDPVTLVVFGHTLPQTPVLEVFASGAGAMLFVVLGVATMRAAVTRRLDRRAEAHDLEDEQEESLRRLRLEKEQLQRELDLAAPAPGRPRTYAASYERGPGSLVADLRDD